jgi:hypothetical protein
MLNDQDSTRRVLRQVIFLKSFVFLLMKSSILYDLLTITLWLVLKLRFFSKYIPKSLIEFTFKSGKLFILNWKSKELILRVKDIAWHLFILRGRWFFSIQRKNLFKLVCKLHWSSTDLILQNIFASSANRRILIEGSRTSGRSFINIKNNKGPKWDPYGTPNNAG